MNRDEALVILSDSKDELREKFGVKSIAVFGSTARNEAQSGSDVDVLVEFDSRAEIGLFKFIRLQWQLEELLENKVDLVTRGGLFPQLKDSILKEAVYVS
jgi:predicted nucleotidyltransferase